MTRTLTQGCLVGLLLLTPAGGARAQEALPPPAVLPQAAPLPLTLKGAVNFALVNNPALAAHRQQRGIAAAKVIIADTYPFNPVLENRVQGAEGPRSGGITNRVPLEHLLLWEVELFGQRDFRRQGAAAGLSRVDWEVAAFEQTLAIQVIRAYANVVYRHEKMQLIEETVRFNERLVEDVEKLVKSGRLRTSDLLIAQTEVTDTLDLVGAGRESLTTARQELFRALGTVDGRFALDPVVDLPLLTTDSAALTELALTRRADLQARRMAVNEAAANLRLTAANRWGNPTVGPAYSYDPSGVNMFGAQVNIPIPVVNTRRGEIRQAEAEQGLANLELRETEVTVRQDVRASLARLEVAEQRAALFRTRVLPELQRTVADMERLFQAGDTSVDLLRVIDVRRKLLRARDSFLDAQAAVRQARADVLAAIGDPAVSLCDPK